MRPRGPAILKIILVGIIVWGLWLPLNDLLTYPDRVSVVPNLAVDAEAYHDLARELSATWRNNIPTKFPPLWIGLMAAVYSFVGVSFVAGKLISWTGLVISVATAAWLARRVYGAPAAWAAAVLCATSSGLRAYVGTLQYEVVTATFLLVATALAVRAVDSLADSSHFRRLATAGLAGALLILTRETFVVAVALLAMWIAHQELKGSGRRAPIRSSALYLAFALSLPFAWSVVQSTREGRFVPLADKGPITIALGNHPTANGTYNEPLVGMAEPAGVPFMLQHPGRTVVLFARKALYFWGVLRDGWSAPQPENVAIWRATTGALPLPLIGSIVRGGWLLAAFLISIWLLGRTGLTKWWVLPGIVIGLWAIHVISLSSYRFALPTVPVSYVVVSGPIAQLARRIGAAIRMPAVAIATIVLLVLAVAAQYQSWPLHVSYQAADLDGLLASNQTDDVAGTRVRVADAGRGIRPVVLLADEYLPGGSMTATVGARLLTGARDEPAIRIVMSQLDGTTACSADFGTGQLSREQFTYLDVPCRLQAHGPATFAVFTLASADIAIDRVNFSWHH